MSLFQCDNCDKCGCIENTAVSRGRREHFNNYMADANQLVADSYRPAMNMAAHEKFGNYCCVCSPFWFVDGNLSVVPNPEKPQWHNRFPRKFFRKGTLRPACMATSI